MRFLRLVGSLLAGALRPEAARACQREWTHPPALAFHLPALAVLAAALTLAWFILLAFYAGVAQAAKFLYRPDAVFFAAALLGWLVLFFAALPAARSLFLAGAEDELLRSLPYRPLTLSLARFAVLCLLLLPLELFVFLPALIVYLRFARSGLSILAGCAVNVFLVPPVPAALALALVLALRRLPRCRRWAAPVEMALPALLAFLLAALQAALQGALAGVNRAGGLIFQVRAGISLGRLMEAVPPASWAAGAFRPGEEAPSALLCLAFAGAIVAAAVWLATRAVQAGGERGRVRAKTDGRPLKLPAWWRNTLVSLVFREGTLLLSRPGLAFETVLRLWILPVFLLFSAAGPREATAAFSGFVSSSSWAALAAIGAFLFVIDVSFLASTALSREGERFGLSLALPLDGAVQVRAKLAFLLLLALPPAGLALALVYLLFPLPAESLVCAVPGVAAYFVFSATLGLFLDLRRPAFGRASPLFRQNAATVLAAAGDAAALALLGAVAGGALAVGMSPLAAGFLAVTILAAADIALVPRLFRYARRRYAGELEV